MTETTTYRRVLISGDPEKHPDFRKLFGIFAATLKPGMRYLQFKHYYCSGRLECIDITFIYSGKTLAGFCAAAFYTTPINGKNYTIGRAATGILPEYRGHRLPKWKLYSKYIRYWYLHPFQKLILSAYVANPLIYAMICKYTGVAYPREGAVPPEEIVRLKDALLESQNLQKKEGPPFVVEIHFCVDLGEKEVDRIYTSREGSVRYYLKINPRFRQQYGVVVVIPVNGKNILLSGYKFIFHRCVKFFRAAKFA